MTIRQIAEFHGVVPSTVSLVLNDKPGVRKELRQKIQKTLIENGYSIRSANAQTQKGNLLFIYYKSTDYLAARKDNTISSILSGIEQVCEENKYTFNVATATADTLDDTLLSATPETAAGIILLGTEYFGEPGDIFFNLSVPLVVLDGFFPEYPLNTVNIDNSYGIHQAIKLLVDNGHTDIGYIKSNVEFGCLRDRTNCIYSSMKKLLDKEPACVIDVDQETDLIQKKMDTFIQNHQTIPSAFIADNDIIAISALQVLQKNGYHVPDDVSIIGFDGSDIGTIFSPYLTTVRTNMTEMAKLAALRVLELIENPSSGFIRSTVAATLVERQTVSPKK